MQIRMLREIDAMFEDAPQSRKTLEVKEEMLQNLMEKYNDLIAQGKTEEAAFNIAIGSVGDISDLLEELNHQPVPKVASFPEPDMSGYDDYNSAYVPDAETYTRHSKALTVATAIMLYILSPVAVIIFGGKLGLILLFTMIAGATGLLIYHGMTTEKQKNGGAATGGDGMHEDSAAAENPYADPTPRDPGKMSKSQKHFFASLSSALWLITVALYFVISFYTGAWHITWIIFLIAAAANNVLKAYMDMSRGR